MVARKSYSIDFKKKICAECDINSHTKVCQKYGLDERMVRRWKSEIEEEQYQECSGSAKRLKGAGRKPVIEELEDIIFQWICDRRSRSLVVRRKDIITFALTQHSISCESGSLITFKASSNWLSGFMKRHNLSLRRYTTLFKIPDTEIVAKAVSFKKFIDNIGINQYDPEFVIAMDETAVYFGEETQTTVAARGSTSIRVPSTGYESYRVTCILAIKRNGEKMMPLLITKGKRASITISNGIMVLETEKAWCTQEALHRWIERAFPRVLMTGKRGLLVWDSASTHRATDMKRYTSLRRIDQVMIPSGTTAYLQSLDIAINKPFKDYLREEINEFIEFRQERNPRGNLVKPKIEEVINWVKKAWDKITPENVANALISGYLFPNQTFEETAISKHERIGPLLRNVNEAQHQENVLITTDYAEVDELAIFSEEEQ